MKKTYKKTGAIFFAIAIISISAIVPAGAGVTQKIKESKNQSMMDSIIIEKCWEQWEDPTFRSKLVSFKAIIENVIDLFPINIQEDLRKVFDMDTAFNLETLKNNILSLRVGSVFEDTQTLLKQPKNSNQMGLLENNMKNYLSVWENDKDVVGQYDIIDEICEQIGTVSLLWAKPLVLLCGVKGIIYANLVSIILFSPILVPAWIYMACSEALIQNPNLRKILENMTIEQLLTDGLKLLKDEIYDNSYLLESGLYILTKIIISSWNNGKPEYDENRPVIEAVYTPGGQSYKPGDPVTFYVLLVDIDQAYYDNDPPAIDRDNLQIGFDWDRDGDFDYWTRLDYMDSEVGETTHKWYEPGTYKVDIVIRDQWGIRSEIVTSPTFTISKSRSKSDIQLFLNNFPILVKLLQQFQAFID